MQRRHYAICYPLQRAGMWCEPVCEQMGIISYPGKGVQNVFLAVSCLSRSPETAVRRYGSPVTMAERLLERC